jgi:hypothetical protein
VKYAPSAMPQQKTPNFRFPVVQDMGWTNSGHTRAATPSGGDRRSDHRGIKNPGDGELMAAKASSGSRAKVGRRKNGLSNNPFEGVEAAGVHGVKWGFRNPIWGRGGGGRGGVQKCGAPLSR